MISIPLAIKVILMGCGATLVMDAWLMMLKRLGVPALNFGFIGRWVGHLWRGTFMHASIATAAPVPGELALGWATHYVVGIAFAGLLVAIAGTQWMTQPTLLPAMLVGMATAAAPFLLMQPAMGLGIAASKTPQPWRNRLRSLANHTIFGGGLYLTAMLIAQVQP